MAKKKVTAVIKLQCPAGKATPAPPVGPALGPHGVSAPQFVQQFNDRTKSMEPGLIVPVIITVFQDKSFTFVLKTPPAAVLIKKAVGIEKGSGNSILNKVGKLSAEKLEEIADSFEGVDKSFAIQAGREVRLIVKPEKVSDSDMVIMAREVAKKVENEMEYPGQIKVNVIRESRVIDYAK